MFHVHVHLHLHLHLHRVVADYVACFEVLDPAPGGCGGEANSSGHAFDALAYVT